MAVELASQLKVMVFEVAFNNITLGYTGGVKPIIKPKYVDLLTAQTYQQAIGARLTGIDARVEIVLKEWLKDTFKLAFPWYSGSGAVPAMPLTLGADLYDYAKALKLHPVHKGDASEDMNFPKAVCSEGYEIEADGAKQTDFKLIFRIFPDRAQLPDMSAGTVST